MTAPARDAFPFLRRLLPAAIALAFLAGLAARLFLLFERPLWHDEIYTLTVARKPVAELLSSLTIDSGPPLHYLAAKLLLLVAGPRPSQLDLLVRGLSLAASLAHWPLFLLVGRRLGLPRAGLPAAALFAVLPLAVQYAAEGRAYALASFLVLLAFERALAVRGGSGAIGGSAAAAPSDPAGAGAAAGLALAAAAAVLTHYLSAFPLVGFVALLHGAAPPAKRRLAAAGAGAVALTLPWVLVAAGQPRASMEWALDTPLPVALRHFTLNISLGIEGEGRLLQVLLPLGLGTVAIASWHAFRAEWRERLAPVALVFGGGLLALLAAQLLGGRLILPERSALPFLPFLAFLLAAAPAAVPLGTAVVSLWVLILQVPMATVPSPATVLSGLLVPRLQGQPLVAVGPFALELDYRSRAAGLPGRVLPFPSEAVAHPGWYREPPGELPRYRREARDLMTRLSPPALFLLPNGYQASAALRESIAPLRPYMVLVTPLLQVVGVPPRAAPEAAPAR